jgi:hypothetical protein
VKTLFASHPPTNARQRVALVLMGAWIAGTICTSVVAAENFYTIDRLLAGSPNSAFRAAVQQLGQPLARDLLRFLSSELNRLFFQIWNLAQLAIGALALWSIAPVRSRRRSGDRDGTGLSDRPAAWGVVAMLAIVVAMLAWLTPAIVSLGRTLDFVPRDPAPPGMRQFWILHAAYTSLETIKLLIGVWVAYRLSLEPPAVRRSATLSAERTTLT